MENQRTIEQRIENFKGIYNRLEKIVDNIPDAIIKRQIRTTPCAVSTANIIQTSSI